MSEIKQPRYFVTAPIEKDSSWAIDVFSSLDLKEALKMALIERARGYKEKTILAKEIGYKIETDTKKLTARVVPESDVDNSCPYYLIEQWKSDGDLHRTTQYEKWDNITRDLLSARGRVTLAKGLEVKLEVKD